MRPSADPGTHDASPAPVLEDGIARYVELFRAQGAARDVETARLVGDLTAERFTQGYAATITRFDSYIAAPGREIPVRIFDPGGSGPRPAICYFHGGGFSMGSVESFDIACAALAEATGAVVISVHYRRLPEADYSAAQDDCDLAFAWAVQQAEVLGMDSARVGVGGDSAGALLAFACSANRRDTSSQSPAFQLLFYGTFAMDTGRPAHIASRDPLLTGERVQGYIALFREHGGLARNPAPVDRDDLAGLPPTHIVAAEHDPLFDEGMLMAERLRAAGVKATHQIAQDMIHGFLRAVGVSPGARRELGRAAEAMRSMIEELG